MSLRRFMPWIAGGLVLAAGPVMAGHAPLPSGCSAGDHWLKSGEIVVDAQNYKQAFADWRRASKEYASCAGTASGRKHYLYLLFAGKADYSAGYAYQYTGIDQSHGFPMNLSMANEYKEDGYKRYRTLMADKNCPSDLKRLANTFLNGVYVGTDWPDE